MPCNTRQTSTVEFGATTDVKLLKLALEQSGYRVTQAGAELSFSSYSTTGSFLQGSLVVSSDRAFDEKALKRAYSAEVVKAAGARFGWKVSQPGANKFTVQRRV